MMMELIDDACTCGHSEREHAVEYPSPCQALWYGGFRSNYGEPCQCKSYRCEEAEEINGEDF